MLQSYRPKAGMVKAPVLTSVKQHCTKYFNTCEQMLKISHNFSSKKPQPTSVLRAPEAFYEMPVQKKPLHISNTLQLIANMQGLAESMIK